MSFREQKAFVLKTVILLAFDLGICEGVGEDSGHRVGHVDIFTHEPKWSFLLMYVSHDIDVWDRL